MVVKAGLRAAACGGRPRAGNDAMGTGEPASPSHQVEQQTDARTRRPYKSPFTGDAHACRSGEHGGMVLALLAVLGVDLIVIARVEVAAPADSRQRALGHSRPP
jgi:hypothetical protein